MIVTDEDVLGGEPRIEGTRVGVRHVVEMAVDGGQNPAYVANQVGVSLSEVYAALSYYYGNPEELESIRRSQEEALDRGREQGLQPKEPAE